MSPVLYPLVGVAALAGFVVLLAVIAFLWPVFLGVGLVGLVTTIGGGAAAMATGTEPAWLAYVALGSLGCVFLGTIGLEDY